jgi:hypothetical protein
MRYWKLTSLIVLLAVTFVPIPSAWANGPIGDLVGAPEPGTFLLLAPGLVGLAGIAWRRHRRK